MIYTFTKQVNLDNLEKEISDSNITIALQNIQLTGSDDLSIEFKATLSQAEETTLNTIVTNHDHTLPSSNPPINVDIVQPKDVYGRAIIASSPFSDAAGFRYRGASFSDTIQTNTTNYIDYLLTDERWINGGRAIIDNIGQDDKVTFQVIDKDNVLGYGANTVLDQFIDGFYVPQDGNLEVNLAYPARIIAGLYIRLKYTSTHANGCTLKCNLYLHWFTG